MARGKRRGKRHGSREEKRTISPALDNLAPLSLLIPLSGILLPVFLEEKERDKANDEEDCSAGEDGDEDLSLEVLSGGDEIGDFVLEEGVI